MVLDKEGIYTDCMPVCNQDNCLRQATIKCEDCLGLFFCDECDSGLHAINPLHDRMSCKDGIFTYLPQGKYFCEKVWMHCKNCICMLRNVLHHSLIRLS